MVGGLGASRWNGGGSPRHRFSRFATRARARPGVTDCGGGPSARFVQARIRTLQGYDIRRRGEGT
jgi:hypothetical protein